MANSVEREMAWSSRSLRMPMFLANALTRKRAVGNMSGKSLANVYKLMHHWHLATNYPLCTLPLRRSLFAGPTENRRHGMRHRMARCSIESLNTSSPTPIAGSDMALPPTWPLYSRYCSTALRCASALLCRVHIVTVTVRPHPATA